MLGRLRTYASGAAALALVALTAVAPASASAPTLVPIDRDATLGALVCPSRTQCTALDVYEPRAGAEWIGRELTFNPTAPGHPRPIALDTTGFRFAGLACPTLAQCTAVDSGGSEVTFDPVAPGSPGTTKIGGTLEGVACPSPSQCTAVEKGGGEITFDPASPGSARAIRIVHEVLVAVDCPAHTECTAIGENGSEVTFDPTAAEAVGVGEEDLPVPPRGKGASLRARSASVAVPVTIEEGNVLRAIVCPSVTQCTAVDDGRDGRTEAITFDPTAPAAPNSTTLDSGGLLDYAATAIACPSVAQCTVAQQTGPLSAGLETFAPSAARSPAPVNVAAAASGLSCPSLAQCTAAIGINEATFNPTTLGGGAAHPWTRTQCRGAYETWTGQHRHASHSQSKAEANKLRKSHGCPASSL